MKILGSFKALAHVSLGILAIEIVAYGFRCSQRVVFFETVCRGLPGGKSLSLGYRPRESNQTEGDPQSGSLRCTAGDLRKGQKSGVCRTRFAQTTAALIPVFAPFAGPDRTGLTKAGTGSLNPNPNSSSISSVCAEECRAGRIRADTCLSRRRVCVRPRLDRALQVAPKRSVGDADSRVAFSLAYFSFGEAKDKASSRRATPGLVMRDKALGVKRLRCLSLNGYIRHKTNSATNPENRKGR